MGNIVECINKFWCIFLELCKDWRGFIKGECIGEKIKVICKYDIMNYIEKMVCNDE